MYYYNAFGTGSLTDRPATDLRLLTANWFYSRHATLLPSRHAAIPDEVLTVIDDVVAHNPTVTPLDKQ